MNYVAKSDSHYDISMIDFNSIDSINNTIDLLNLISKISYTPRRGLIALSFKEESVAAHMYKMVLLCIYFQNKLNLDINLYKCILMCIIHDIAEAYIGDIIPKDNISVNYKHYVEDEVISKILQSRNHNICFDNLFVAYNEYTEQKTVESNLVKFVDKLDFLYEIIRSINKSIEQGSNAESLSDAYSTYKAVLNAIYSHDWGINADKFLHIIKTINVNFKECKTLPDFDLGLKKL